MDTPNHAFLTDHFLLGSPILSRISRGVIIKYNIYIYAYVYECICFEKSIYLCIHMYILKLMYMYHYIKIIYIDNHIYTTCIYIIAHKHTIIVHILYYILNIYYIILYILGRYSLSLAFPQCSDSEKILSPSCEIRPKRPGLTSTWVTWPKWLRPTGHLGMV